MLVRSLSFVLLVWASGCFCPAEHATQAIKGSDMVVAFTVFGSVAKFRKSHCVLVEQIEMESCGEHLYRSLAENWTFNNEISRASKSKVPDSGMEFRQIWQLFSTHHRRNSPISIR